MAMTDDSIFCKTQQKIQKSEKLLVSFPIAYFSKLNQNLKIILIKSQYSWT